ncbi:MULTISPECIES: DNA ligase D [Acidobacteriaceae]|uniref:DNA ligase D n=1 Tax=Acidobacteriaceae TaxID=204434 RepID=UPI00131A62C6|nr:MULTISPECIES: DNA ligase D [Acidobacteriaceae]MDW5266529.1 DNA ligase D [Edaphobacter sp.]
MASAKKSVKKAVEKKAAAKKSTRSSPAKVKAKKPNRAADAVDEQLARYRSMRDFHITAEPSGTGKSGDRAERLPFCIQKHAASHLHYDFRLGWNGVLKSWAVAKGPSYFTGDKRLAVQVEDHPMEYGGFEGIIPAGQYGGGTVMLWDQGTWEPQTGNEDVDKGLRDGSLKFVMHGTKIRGKWALIRMGGKAANERKPNWILIKEHDDFERGKDDPCVTVEEPDSVVTGRTIKQIAHNEDHVWNSKDTAKGKAWYRQIGRGENTGDESGASLPFEDRKSSVFEKKRTMTVSDFKKSLSKLPKENQPGFIAPQLALQAISPPSGEGWLHELKLDGYRMQARKDGSGVQMLTRKGLDWTHRVRAVANEVAKLAVDTVTLDGEVVVLAEDGTTSFADLQASFQDGTKNLLTYFCFDLLHMDGRNIRELPLKQRKEILGGVLNSANADLLRVSEHLETDGEGIFRKACELHAEGIVSKKAAGRYSSGRGGDWLKMKCLHEQEFVVGGFTLPSNGINGVGALLLGYYRDGKLIYAGRTGTGFTQKTHKAIRGRLNDSIQAAVPFEQVPPEARRGVRWVKPELVVQVRFATWTADNLVRQAAFLGVREDKSAEEVVREEASVAPRPKGTGRKPVEPRTSAKTAATHKVKGRVAAKETATMEHAPVRLTHPEKILDEKSGMTKQMLADYYWAVAEEMLPHIANRPLSLVRCPDGADKPCFYQKHASHALPDGVGSVDVADKNGKIEPYITLSTAEALTGLAQMGVLEVHPWGSRNEDLEHPDRLIFDLDPDEALGWKVLTEAAAEVRRRLKAIGLESFLKTTGGKGLHVVVPIAPKLEWSAAKEFAHGFVNAMEKANPSLYLTKMTKAARKGKIYLDYLRNERGATSVAPFSPRARAGSPVSLPLKWSDLKLAERPVFSVATFGEWKARLKTDPWKKMTTMKQRITSEALASVEMKQSA